MAAALLRAALDDAGVAAVVDSAGTLGWGTRPATPHAVAVMAERGLDIGEHRSRRLDAVDLDVDLVVAMTRDHAGAVIARDPALRPRVFLPAEYARLRGAEPVEPARRGIAGIDRVGARRPSALIGRPHEEIADPAGEPLEVYRRTAERLDRDLGALVRALVE
jgi:protein-tyrosine-phosphatase